MEIKDNIKQIKSGFSGLTNNVVGAIGERARESGFYRLGANAVGRVEKRVLGVKRKKLWQI